MNNFTQEHGDIAWVMTSTALVYMMTPALACFYGGLVETKNFLNQLFLSFICMALVPVQWCLFGYSFAFGPGNSVFGSFEYALERKLSLINVNSENVDNINPTTIPSLAFSAFHCAFAIVTPALISGAVVGRMKLIPYMIFIFLWTTFCYDPIARWTFSNQGWLHQIGVMDFAGGLVVHTSSGISALVAAIILGSRAHFDPDAINTGQTNLQFTIVGTGLLWVGWMGFNGGSALSAGGVAGLAVINTNVAAAAAMTLWIVVDTIHGKARGQNNVYISIPGVCAATVVGLVVITPSAGYVQPAYALLIGLIGGCVIYLFLAGKKHFFHIDDTLDVFSCHGLGGSIGTLMTGLFSQSDVNKDGKNGAFYGNPMQLAYQLLGVTAVAAYSAACTAIILLAMHFTIGIRLPRLDQVRGMDNVVHGVTDLEGVQRAPRIKIVSMKLRDMEANAAAANPNAKQDK